MHCLLSGSRASLRCYPKLASFTHIIKLAPCTSKPTQPLTNALHLNTSLSPLTCTRYPAHLLDQHPALQHPEPRSYPEPAIPHLHLSRWTALSPWPTSVGQIPVSESDPKTHTVDCWRNAALDQRQCRVCFQLEDSETWGGEQQHPVVSIDEVTLGVRNQRWS
jgi:hypothetical protein